MSTPDPVDIRLLSLLAETGAAAVHEVAARAGIDAREAASRLVALSASGLPLLVGVRCDAGGIRGALARMTAPVSQQPVPAAVPEADAVIRTWGPPQTASWARGDTPAATPPPGYPSTGPLGARLHGRGPAGQPVAVTLLELVDPADFLYSAAGYRLPPGARAVVVHAELANHGNVPLAAQADAFLVLVASDGTAFGKAPTVLASRPPHPVAAMPGSLADGHTVYLVPEHAVINAVRWSAGGGSIALTWTV